MNSIDRNSVLVVAAHPDDELLGVGGTIALHVENGDHVTLLVVAAGGLIHDHEKEGVAIAEAHAAAQIMGVEDLRLLDFPDQRLDTLCLVDIITPLERIVEEIRPTIVYVQWGGDINRDHKLVFDAALVALRPMERSLSSIFAFDTVSSTEWGYPRSFIPDTWVDITSTIERKLKAIGCYASELRAFPHPRSIECLRAKAAATGAQCCMLAAEAFMTIRTTIRDGKTPA